jgi:hypothetical protein
MLETKDQIGMERGCLYYSMEIYHMDWELLLLFWFIPIGCRDGRSMGYSEKLRYGFIGNTFLSMVDHDRGCRPLMDISRRGTSGFGGRTTGEAGRVGVGEGISIPALANPRPRRIIPSSDGEGTGIGATLAGMMTGGGAMAD